MEFRAPGFEDRTTTSLDLTIRIERRIRYKSIALKSLGIAPVLIVHPLMRAVDFYQKKLGFGYPQLIGNPATMAVLERDGFSLHLQEAEFEITISPSGGWDLHLRVEELQAEIGALETLGVPIDFGPTEIVDGLRKRAFFEIVDPDNYRICIEQQIWLTAPIGNARP
jgi:catechol 2,3-dioxygenase-like lactoylglutathione lyase family enzyme